MVRLIKRYESRKLYDTEESRYVSLDEIAEWVRQGQEIQVADNATGTDVTAQTLTQIILEGGRKGTSRLPNELLHDLIRRGEQALSSGVEQVSQGVDRLVRASIDKLGPVRRARDEMEQLRERLEQLERTLVDLETQQDSEPASTTADQATASDQPTQAKPARKTSRKTAAGKTTATKTKKTTATKSQDSASA